MSLMGQSYGAFLLRENADGGDAGCHGNQNARAVSPVVTGLLKNGTARNTRSWRTGNTIGTAETRQHGNCTEAVIGNGYAPGSWRRTRCVSSAERKAG